MAQRLRVFVAFAEDLGSLVPRTHMSRSQPTPVPGDAIASPASASTWYIDTHSGTGTAPPQFS